MPRQIYTTIHPPLTESSALSIMIDFSLPDAEFKACLSRLGNTVLHQPAYTSSLPPSNTQELRLRIASGGYKMKVGVRPTGDGGVATVEDVLRKIRKTLWESLASEGSSTGCSRLGEKDFKAAEYYQAQRMQSRKGRDVPRVVDRLWGHTLFAGLELYDEGTDGRDARGAGGPLTLQVELAVPERYQP
ncbi:hypothetical protein HMN09_00355000 [Mycena chlorophos]|uniref:DUF6699 domain-containing protein n=1 Tax=Mycena chlorophos TaxID=658473 RepID=A0A8H6TIQ6_MYCCL|nr:hypothetical protein HMN09_00355000 [Mycena chlorophos]